ncbi:MAG: hypothetical protein K2O14_15575, partial [Oscillospiraceae bacterium]|nr:hypothetical protein [Oscillospiraceae bacterium]
KASCTCTFTDEGFSIYFSDRNGATHTDFNYGSLKYAAEHDKYFRLQFSREKAFIMKGDLRSGFVWGDKAAFHFGRTD